MVLQTGWATAKRRSCSQACLAMFATPFLGASCLLRGLVRLAHGKYSSYFPMPQTSICRRLSWSDAACLKGNGGC